ncbi:duplicated homeodomain-like superfamily protein [Anaeramoeba ignava]|uniref:Duplicated homeodomain-like superfamily protein n=1 Tax=Anaeramoeba ignava TaxID=1746090 RepID=A0A9Q0LL55_ANAIG|nr:duplicated homeodomain-like superfamily protein [Anaeramoeba ignava]
MGSTTHTTIRNNSFTNRVFETNIDHSQHLKRAENQYKNNTNKHTNNKNRITKHTQKVIMNNNPTLTENFLISKTQKSRHEHPQNTRHYEPSRTTTKSKHSPTYSVEHEKMIYKKQEGDLHGQRMPHNSPSFEETQFLRGSPNQHEKNKSKSRSIDRLEKKTTKKGGINQQRGEYVIHKDTFQRQSPYYQSNYDDEYLDTKYGSPRISPSRSSNRPSFARQYNRKKNKNGQYKKKKKDPFSNRKRKTQGNLLSDTKTQKMTGAVGGKSKNRSFAKTKNERSPRTHSPSFGFQNRMFDYRAKSPPPQRLSSNSRTPRQISPVIHDSDRIYESGYLSNEHNFRGLVSMQTKNSISPNSQISQRFSFENIRNPNIDRNDPSINHIPFLEKNPKRRGNDYKRESSPPFFTSREKILEPLRIECKYPAFPSKDQVLKSIQNMDSSILQIESTIDGLKQFDQLHKFKEETSIEMKVRNILIENQKVAKESKERFEEICKRAEKPVVQNHQFSLFSFSQNTNHSDDFLLKIKSKIASKILLKHLIESQLSIYYIQLENIWQQKKEDLTKSKKSNTQNYKKRKSKLINYNNFDEDDDEDEQSRIRDYLEVSAPVPPMIIIPTERKLTSFYDNNRLINAETSREVFEERHPEWTEEEVSIFLKIYSQSPKDFRLISNYLPNRSMREIIQFYYINRFKLGLNKNPTQRQTNSKKKVIQEGTTTSRRRRAANSKNQSKGNNDEYKKTELSRIKKRRRRKQRRRKKLNKPNQSQLRLENPIPKNDSDINTNNSIDSNNNNINNNVNTNNNLDLDNIIDQKQKVIKNFWDDNEKKLFIQLLKEKGRDWVEIANSIETKTPKQVKNFFQNNKKKLGLLKILESGGHPINVNPRKKSNQNF